MQQISQCTGCMCYMYLSVVFLCDRSGHGPLTREPATKTFSVVLMLTFRAKPKIKRYYSVCSMHCETQTICGQIKWSVIL